MDSADKTSQILQLEDGRNLGYAEYGDLSSTNVAFHFHGLPGSRYEGAMFQNPAQKLGIRIVTIDRPGIGLSSPLPGRVLLDFPKDVQALARHLKVQQYSAIGVSGGGPYAAACAYAIPPSELRSVALVAGMCPYQNELWKNNMLANRWLMWGFSNPYARGFARVLSWVSFGPLLSQTDDAIVDAMRGDSSMSWLVPKPPEVERKAVADGEIGRILVREMREALKNGYEPYMEDGVVLCGPLGFDIAETPEPKRLRLWYGKLDINVSADVGEWYHKALHGEPKLTITEDTHLSLVVNQREAVLRDLSAPH